MKRLFHGMLTQTAVRTAETRLYGAAASRGKGNWQGAGLRVNRAVTGLPSHPQDPSHPKGSTCNITYAISSMTHIHMGCVSTLVSSAPLSPKACECMGQSVPNWGSAGSLSCTSYELLQRLLLIILGIARFMVSWRHSLQCWQ